MGHFLFADFTMPVARCPYIDAARPHPREIQRATVRAGEIFGRAESARLKHAGESATSGTPSAKCSTTSVILSEAKDLIAIATDVLVPIGMKSFAALRMTD
jgi:hypothetical protein